MSDCDVDRDGGGGKTRNCEGGMGNCDGSNGTENCGDVSGRVRAEVEVV